MSVPSNECRAITLQSLQSQCPHGLVEDYPISDHLMQKQWKKGNVYNKTIKKKIWRPTWIYNVVCQHSNCINQQTWRDRTNYRSFRSGHWYRHHPQNKNIECKVVSFWKTVHDDDSVKYITEYRLVSMDDLKYIAAANQSDDDIQMHVVDTVISQANEPQNIAQHTPDPNENIDINILETIDENAAHHDNISDTFDEDENEDEDLNSNSNHKKRKLSHATHSLPKRQKRDTDDISPLHTSLTRELSTTLTQMRAAIVELHSVQKKVDETQQKLQETQQKFEEMMMEFKEQQKSHAQQENQAGNQILINNEMNINLKDIQSVNLKQYASNEGKNIWSLEEAKDDDANFLLQCKICDAFADILDDDRNEQKQEEYKQADNERIPPKRIPFVRGQLISNDQAESHSFFVQKWKTMKHHCQTNKHHIGALKIMNLDINLCANNIMVKSEVAYQIFSRSEPDILFHKLLIMLHR